MIQPLPVRLRRQLDRALARNQRHIIAFCQRLQPRRHVHRIAQHRVAAPDAGAHVAHAHHPAVDADIEPDGRLPQLNLLGIELYQHCGNIRRGFDSQPGMVGDRQGRPPKCHDAIANVFVDGALIAGNDGGNAVEQAVEHSLHLLRRHVFCQPGELLDIAEHDAQLARLHRRGVCLWPLDHFAHQRGRHIVPEQGCQLPLGARFQKQPVADVQHICQHHRHQTGGQRQRHMRLHIGPGIDARHRQHQTHTQKPCARSPHARQHHQQHGRYQKNRHQCIPTRVIGHINEAAVQHGRQQRGMHLHTGI